MTESESNQAIYSMNERETRRFYAMVEENTFGCHRWNGSLNNYGYGAWKIDNVSVLAHRVAFFLAYGYLPESHRLVCHTCNNEWCVRHDGSASDNNRDVESKPHFRDVDEQVVEELYRVYLDEGLSVQASADKIGIGRSMALNILQGTHHLGYLGKVTRTPAEGKRLLRGDV